MLDHVSLGVTDLERSKAFYDAVLKPLGVSRFYDYEGGLGYGTAADRIQFWIGTRSMLVGRRGPAAAPMSPSAPPIARPSMNSIARRSPMGARTTASRACGPSTTRTTTARSCSIRTAIRSKPAATGRHDNEIRWLIADS